MSKTFKAKQMLVQKNVRFKKVVVQKNVVQKNKVQRNLGPKEIWLQNNFGS